MMNEPLSVASAKKVVQMEPLRLLELLQQDRIGEEL